MSSPCGWAQQMEGRQSWSKSSMCWAEARRLKLPTHPIRAVQHGTEGTGVAAALAAEAVAEDEGGRTALPAPASPQLMIWLHPLDAAQDRGHSRGCGTRWLPGSGPASTSEPARGVHYPASPHLCCWAGLSKSQSCWKGLCPAGCGSLTALPGVGAGSQKQRGLTAPPDTSPSCSPLRRALHLQPSWGWSLHLCSAAPAGRPGPPP